MCLWCVRRYLDIHTSEALQSHRPDIHLFREKAVGGGGGEFGVMFLFDANYAQRDLCKKGNYEFRLIFCLFVCLRVNKAGDV